MNIAVVAPYRPGCAWRDRAWAFCQRRYRWPIVVGECAEGPYNRSEAILDGARRADAEILVVADADVFTDGLELAVDQVAAGAAWAVPHQLIHRLSPQSTLEVLAGGDWHGLPLSTDNPQDRKPYPGNETGTLLVIRRDALEQAPPDARFIGWGSEDVAWAVALRTLVGPPWRGTADLVHCWHPAQPRQTRRVGNPDSLRLLRRYQNARRRPDAMRALIEEVTLCPTPSTS